MAQDEATDPVQSPQVSNTDQASTRNRWAWVILLLLMCLAFAVRTYRLDEQSLWWDDYNGLAHLTKSGFVDVMDESRRMNPEGAPLYHAVQYVASLVIGNSEIAHRLFNVCLNVLTLVIIFGLGRNLFGTLAGLVAAACLALSPEHLFHAQSIRIYPLEVLLAAISLYAFERFWHTDQRRWMWINVIANALLPWTHFFGVLAAIAQGTSLVVFVWGHWRKAILWCVVQGLLLLPVAVWVLTMARVSAVWHFHAPDAEQIFLDLFGDDLVFIATSGDPWALRLFGWDSSTDAFRNTMKHITTSFFVLVVLSAVICWAWQGTRMLTGKGVPRKVDQWQGYALLVLFWLVPPLILTALSYLIQPCWYPRYSLYSTLALYTLTGAFVQNLRWKPVQGVAIIVLVTLFAYQLMFLMPVDARTQWRQVGQYLTEQVQPDDVVLVGAFGPASINHRAVCYHTPPMEVPIVETPTMENAVNQARCHLLAKREEGKAAQAWFVLNMHFGRTTPTHIYDYLIANDFKYDFKFFGAMEMIILVRIHELPEDAATRPMQLPPHVMRDVSFDNEFSYRAQLEALGLAPDDETYLRQLADVWDDGIFYDDAEKWGTLSHMLANAGHFELAERCAMMNAERPNRDHEFDLWYVWFSAGELQKALKLAAELPAIFHNSPEFALLPLALTLHAAGEADAASAVYRSARPVLAEEDWPFLSITDAAFSGDHPAARTAALAVRHSFYPFIPYQPYEFYRVIGLEKWITPCARPWAPAPVAEELRKAVAAEAVSAFPRPLS
jgi:4-amino-4-deoxy-L-arabinose transferase-like glycosyltransferase